MLRVHLVEISAADALYKYTINLPVPPCIGMIIEFSSGVRYCIKKITWVQASPECIVAHVKRIR